MRERAGMTRTIGKRSGKTQDQADQPQQKDAAADDPGNQSDILVFKIF